MQLRMRLGENPQAAVPFISSSFQLEEGALVGDHPLPEPLPLAVAAVAAVSLQGC